MANNSRTKRKSRLNNKLTEKKKDNLLIEEIKNGQLPLLDEEKKKFDIGNKRVLESIVVAEEDIPILDEIDNDKLSQEIQENIENSNKISNDEEFIPLLDDDFPDEPTIDKLDEEIIPILDNDVPQEVLIEEEIPQKILTNETVKSEKKSSKKYFTVVSVFSCLVLFIIVMGVSYAFFTTSIKGKDFVVYTGNLAVDYEKKTDAIGLESVYPITDKEGLKLIPHEFTIKNNGNIDARYQIRLELDNSTYNMIDIKYIKISYQENGGEYSAPTLLSDLNSSLAFVKNVILNSGQSNTYGIKLWIDLNAPNDIQGKVFKAKVVVDSIQNVEDGFVIDTAPIIYLNSDDNGNQDIHLKTNDSYRELGVNRIEDDQEVFTTNQATITYEYYDGINLSVVDNIDTSKNGIYYVNYSIIDKSNNVGKATRIVTVNPTDSIPSITLNGDTTIQLGEMDYYRENGVTVENDNHVVIIGEVKTSTIGTYFVRYIVIDDNGNMNSTTRTVTIIKGYQESTLNGADPVLTDELIPVIIGSDGVVQRTSTLSKWYSYGEKNWANAVILKDGSTNYISGEIITEDNIESYFVWIPRYKYKIFNEGNYNNTTDGFNTTTPEAIEVVFENKRTEVSTGSKVGEYLTHPAFTAFDVNGLWVGKFETGYFGATSTSAAQVNSSDASKIIIKPNVYSWRGITVGNAFEASYNYLRELDSHMMKNTEWGAMAYLTNSSYGRCDSGVCSEIRINNNSNYITGYAATVEPTLGYNNGVSIEGNRVEGTSPRVDGEYTVNYLNSNSNVASTTGNKSGIYDTSGGAWDYVMGYTAGATTEGGASGITSIHSDFFTNAKWNKYYDRYPSTTITGYNNRILGDATGELGPFGTETDPDNEVRYKSSWYEDYAFFVTSFAPWFERGGPWHYGLSGGSFEFDDYTGAAHTGISFRVVLAP